jgi:cell division protein FtsB
VEKPSLKGNGFTTTTASKKRTTVLTAIILMAGNALYANGVFVIPAGILTGTACAPTAMNKRRKKTMTMIYDIIPDILALKNLINDLTDEETGESREVTEEERQSFLGWIKENETNFNEKFDNICRLFKILKAQADVAAAERDTLKAEMDRLSKRATARENEAERLKSLLWFALDSLKMTKYKTALFSAGIQNTRKTVRPTSIFNPDEIPVEYLRRELAPSLITEAVKTGALYEKPEPENRTKLFYRGEAGEQELKGVAYVQGSALVIR